MSLLESLFGTENNQKQLCHSHSNLSHKYQNFFQHIDLTNILLVPDLMFLIESLFHINTSTGNQPQILEIFLTHKFDGHITSS